MPDIAPLTASGSREMKRPRSIPKAVREALRLMVYGREDDPDCKPLDFIEAAKLASVKPDVMRRYLDRGDVRALLRAERRVFREAICAGNERSLRHMRDTAANGMVRLGAIRVLEQIDAVETARPAGMPSPGICIRIITPGAAADPPKDITPAAVTIEHEPTTSDVDTEAQDAE